MKKFFGKRGSSQSLASQLPSELAVIDERSPVVLRRPQTINFDAPKIRKPGSSFSQNGSAFSLPSLSKSNPPSPVTFTPPNLRRLKKTRSTDSNIRHNLTSFNSGSSLHSAILTQSDSMTSLSRDGSSLNSSMTSLSLADHSPLSSSMNLTESLKIASEANDDVKNDDAVVTSSTDGVSGREGSEKKKRKGLFRFPFKHRHKDGERRRGSADVSRLDVSEVRKNRRSQSLTPENINDLFSRLKEENAELQLAVRGKEEELKLLNASIDISNRTWENKVEALQRDVIQERKKNEKLTQMITKDLLPSPSKRIPIDASPKSPNREAGKDAHELRHPSPVVKRRGVWEPSRKFVVAKSFEKTPEVRQRLEKAIMASKCLSQLSHDIIIKIVDVMKVKRINKGERLMAESTLGANFYVLAEGDCRIYKHAEELSKGSNLVVGERVPLWSVFGETDIFYHTKRVSSCKSVQPGVVWFISRDEYTSVVRQQDINKRKKEIYYFFRRIEGFRSVESKQFQDLVKQCKVEHFSSGDYVAKQGDAITSVYVIKEGNVRVTKHVDGTESLQSTLTSGQLIGDVTDASCHVSNYVASDGEVVQCIVIPSEHYNAVRHHMTSLAKQQVTSEHVERNVKMHLTVSDGGSEGSGSSGYGSEIKKKERRMKYGEQHEMEHKKISEKLHGKGRDQFNFISTIGNGAFGTVDLVATNTGDYHVFAIKKLSRQEILKSEQQQQVRSERSLQLHTSQHCPFIASLYRTFEDHKFVYLVMEYCAGGELFSLLKRLKRFDNQSARFYSACMVEALSYLHSRHIVFRDLKPENVVVDKSGYCKLTDFGFAKHLGGARSAPRTYTFCGTPEYMAPETIMYKAQTVTVDLWSLGVFIFELLTGKAPFRNSNRKDLGELILGGIQSNLEEAQEKGTIDNAAFSIIDELCQIRPDERLGSGRQGFDDVCSHRWFQGFDWMSLRLRSMPAPWKPKLKTAHDSHYFDTDNIKVDEEFENFDGTFL